MSGVIFRPTPTSADGDEAGGDEAAPAGASRCGRPAKPSSAGSSVSDAATVMATTDGRADGQALHERDTPMSSMPSSEMTTVMPANSTERPAVSMAIATDSRTVWPAWSCSR